MRARTQFDINVSSPQFETVKRLLRETTPELEMTEIARQARVSRSYVYRAKRALSPTEHETVTSPRLARATRALDRAFAQFERQSTPANHQRLASAQRVYDQAKRDEPKQSMLTRQEILAIRAQYAKNRRAQRRQITT